MFRYSEDSEEHTVIIRPSLCPCVTLSLSLSLSLSLCVSFCYLRLVWQFTFEKIMDDCMY